MMKEVDDKVPKVREDTPVIAEGCDDWAPLSSFRFLRWRLLMKGQGELTPRRIALICLEVCRSLCQPSTLISDWAVVTVDLAAS